MLARFASWACESPRCRRASAICRPRSRSTSSGEDQSSGIDAGADLDPSATYCMLLDVGFLLIWAEPARAFDSYRPRCSRRTSVATKSRGTGTFSASASRRIVANVTFISPASMRCRCRTSRDDSAAARSRVMCRASRVALTADPNPAASAANRWVSRASRDGRSSDSLARATASRSMAEAHMNRVHKPCITFWIRRRLEGGA